MRAVSRVGGIILAAGIASRLGRPKQLLPIDGRPLLERTLDVARNSALDPVIVVLGAYRDEIREQVNLSDIELVINDDFQDGQSTSLRAGIEALPSSVAGAVVLLADQPLLPAGLLDDMIESFDPKLDAAVQPRYRERPGNPVLLSRSLFDEIHALEGDTGARGVLKRHQDAIRYLDYTRFPMPRDVDTEDDHQTLLDTWFSLGAPFTARYCPRCGQEMGVEERQGRLRPVCPACNFTIFVDPKLAVAVIIDTDDGIVMQRRKIDPGHGKWTFPSGFVDRGEDLQSAARREVQEEVEIVVDDLELLDIYSEPGETVALVVYIARVPGAEPAPGDESDQVAVVNPRTLPELAFARDARIVSDWLSIGTTRY